MQKNIEMTIKQQIDEISMRIIKNINPEKIILFGSYAKGNYNEDSDLDLIIIKQSNLPKHKRGIEIRRLFYGLLVPIDLKVYTPEEFEMFRERGYEMGFRWVESGPLVRSSYSAEAQAQVLATA